MGIETDLSSNSVYGPQKDVLESASKMVEYHMHMDNTFSELVDCLKMGGELPKVSGLTNEDYPGLPELGLNLQPFAQLNVLKKIPLPTELVEQFSFMKANCQMGLFAEIGRAWLTIDSNIFLWSFHDGSDLAYFDGINEIILCVGLVKPKPGVFQSFIHYLLCLATPTQIVLLGVSFSREHENSPPFEEMHLLPEPLFSFPTDEVIMSCFAGTDGGRIFLGGRDGSLYEFTYQATEGWFKRKCRKINHSCGTLSFLVPNFLQMALLEEDSIAQIVVDNSRNILYARTEKGSIQVFDMGIDGQQMSKVTILHHQHILNKAAAIAETVNKNNFFPLVNLCVVEGTESKVVNLIAITQAGVRLYFTTNINSANARPYTLALLHVRLPPGFSARAVVDQVSNVNMSLYGKGLLMMTATIVEDADILFSASNDMFVFHKQLIETYTGMKSDGHTWAISEIPTGFEFKQAAPSASGMPTVATQPPLLITQHVEVPRQFVILSDQGCCILSKPRPMDIFCKLLVENRGANCEAIKAFFHMFQETQACAMCLAVICSHSQDKQVIEWANRAFFLYGGNPVVSFQVGDGLSSMESPTSPSQLPRKPPIWASTPAVSMDLPQFGGAPMDPQFSTMYSPVKSVLSASSSALHMTNAMQVSQQGLPVNTSTFGSNTEIIYSGKHNGLHLYFSRIMRPLWNLKLVYEKPRHAPDTGPPHLTSSVTSEELSVFLQQLTALRDFIRCYHPHFGSSTEISGMHQLSGFHPRSPHEGQPLQQNKAQIDAEVQERTSILNLQLLMNYTHEALGLWKVLCDHQFESIVYSLSEGNQDQLKQFVFRDFIVDGKDLCMVLTVALINFYLEDNASTTAISDRLRDICPSIFRSEDATVSKAHEMILAAKFIVNDSEREKELTEALKLCKSVCPYVNVTSLCNLFNEQRFYHGTVDLVVCMAQQVDPQGLALHYYQSEEPANDRQGQAIFTVRMNCYKEVTNAIAELIAVSLSHPQSRHIPSCPGPQLERQSHVITPEEAKKDSELLFEMALKTNDELFHSAIYDWLIERNQTNALLSIKSHFLENYLKRRTIMQPDSLQSLDLLWKLYEKNRNFSAAARVLAKLADKHGLKLSLTERLEYLSRAMICIKSSEMRMTSTGEGEFLHELEEKMEVARIQLQILQILQQKKVPVSDEPAKQLNDNFLNITQLYEEYAVPFDLPESKLAIVHCAGHYDPGLIESLWQSIIDKELLETCGNIPDARTKILQQRLQNICQTYVNSEKYFPLDFIMEYLEFKTCTLNFNIKWAYQIFLSVGIPLPELLHCYNKIYRSKDSCWGASTKLLHLLQVLCLLIGEFVSNSALVHQNERRAFVTLSLDVVSGYLVDLQAMNVTNSIVPELMKEYKSIQHKLERFL